MPARLAVPHPLPTPRSRSRAYSLAGLGTAAVLLATARALLILIQEPYLERGLWSLAGRSLANHGLRGLVLCLGPLALIWLSLRISKKRWSSAAIKLGLLVFSFLWLTCRLPESTQHIPEWESNRGLLGNVLPMLLGIALLAALEWDAQRQANRHLQWSGVALGIASLVGLSIWSNPSAANWPTRPNLILISIDTTRPDALGVYGYGLPTTPEIDKFAQRAVCFEKAFTPYPWTLISHASMLTGLTPSAHTVSTIKSLPHGVSTLAERLRASGYQTAAMVSDVQWMRAKFGFGQGFDLYQSMSQSAGERQTYTSQLLDDLGDGPFFLFLHFFDVHSDTRALAYEADPGDLELFTGDYSGDFAHRSREHGNASVLLDSINQSGVQPSAEDALFIRGLYDAGLRSFDRALGRLLDDMQARGLFETSVLLLTSDHGEGFFEHGRALHRGLWDETIWIPFLVRTPETHSPRRVTGMVSLLDVAPTLLDFAGLESAGMQGQSLRGPIQGDRSWSRPGLFLLDNGQHEFGLRTDRWKLAHKTLDGDFLYDLLEDPGEQNNLYGLEAYASIQRNLDQQLESLVQAAKAIGEQYDEDAEAVQLSESATDDLRALGYSD